MLGTLFHRGPDSEGIFYGENYSGGMRRLAINDLARGGQPLLNEDGSIVLFYNGEIYNSPSLRKELGEKGHRFRTRSDGDVIAHLYEEAGVDCFGALDGMFAIALWDSVRERLVLARDIAGEKPLYYSLLSSGEVVFGSEVKSFRHFPGLDLTLNLQAVWDFPTFLWVPEPETIYNEIHALMPGERLIAEKGTVRTERYPDRFSVELIDRTDETVVAATRRIVEEAIELRLLSDVPMGSFLSSGLDSSLVTLIAQRKLGNLSTFTIAFEDVADPYHGRADESAYAAAFARKLGTKHHTVSVTAPVFRSLLDDFCHYGDQPFAVSSGLGILAIAGRASEEGIKVLLSGDGADECFGGYSWYAHLARLRRGAGCVSEEKPVSFQNFGIPIESRLAALGELAAPHRAWAWHYYASEGEKRALFSAELGSQESSIRHFEQYDRSGDWSPERYVAQDRAFYFPNEMLRKVDRMTMARSVEGRAPFAAPSVLSLAGQISYPQMVRGGALKWALRRAFADLLPPEIAGRPKHGFNVPIDRWLKGEWADLLEDTFSSGSALARRGLIGPGSGATALRMLEDPDRLNGHTLFCFVMLNRWLEHES
jgi:asparagine synthase (glutamine-hydrolysing)